MPVHVGEIEALFRYPVKSTGGEQLDVADLGRHGITNRDERCSMVNFDPESARSLPEILEAIVRTRDNKAGAYAAVIRPGRLTVGQPVFFAARSA